MMGMLRGVAGAIVGASAAIVAIRTRQVARERGEPIQDVLASMPEVLRDDLERVGGAARAALDDGMAAAARREREIDSVLRSQHRRSEGER